MPDGCFNVGAWYCVDYDLQVALMEALCRMTSRAQRRELSDRWFSMEFVASAFRNIQDSEFETVRFHVIVHCFLNLFLSVYVDYLDE